MKIAVSYLSSNDYKTSIKKIENSIMILNQLIIKQL